MYEKRYMYYEDSGNKQNMLVDNSYRCLGFTDKTG